MGISPSNQIVPFDQAIAPVRQMLAKNMKGIGAALGGYMLPERFLSSVLTLCRHNPDLADPRKASQSSLLLAVLRVAHLQLSPDPALGQAWIIPRKGKAEFQLGWKGCLALAYRSPLVAAVRYGVVGPNDYWKWRDGASWVLEHDPAEDGWPATLAEVRCAWCIIELRSGRSLPRVMYQAEILRHKERGSGSQPAWVTDPAAMAVKTVIADACRRGPFEGEIGRAFALDHAGEVGVGQPAATDEERAVIDIEPTSDGPMKPSERFKQAHRPSPPPEPAPDPEQSDSDAPAWNLEDDEVFAAPSANEEPETPGRPPVGVDLMEALKASLAANAPEFLSPQKCANLRRLAEERGDADGLELAQKAADLCGSGTLENVPAVYEQDLLKWLSERPKRRAKRQE